MNESKKILSGRNSDISSYHRNMYPFFTASSMYENTMNADNVMILGVSVNLTLFFTGDIA